MEKDIDYTQRTESELVEMFARMDPRYAPAECAQLAKFLKERGYIILDEKVGPGSAVPSPAKMLALIGSSQPIRYAVDFGKGAGAFSWSEPIRNDIGLTGAGSMEVDGVSVWLKGKRGLKAGLIGSQFEETYQLPCRRMANVERQGSLVRFDYGADDLEDGAITLRFADDAKAE